MKSIYFLALFLFTLVSFSQEATTSVKPIDDVNEEEVKAVAFAIIEKVPVYAGCDENMGNQALKECMSSQISSLISTNFNLKLANSLNLPAGKARILVTFKIDKEGNTIDIKAKAPHVELEKEAIRIIQLIPKFKRPGMLRDKPVIVNYGLPISLVINETKTLSKKAQRKLRKKNRA